MRVRRGGAGDGGVSVLEREHGPKENWAARPRRRTTLKIKKGPRGAKSRPRGHPATTLALTSPRPARWPARPGEQQHPLGGAATHSIRGGWRNSYGVPVRLVRASNRNALRAYGNAVGPAGRRSDRAGHDLALLLRPAAGWEGGGEVNVTKINRKRLNPPLSFGEYFEIEAVGRRIGLKRSQSNVRPAEPA